MTDISMCPNVLAAVVPCAKTCAKGGWPTEHCSRADGSGNLNGWKKPGAVKTPGRKDAA